MKKIIQSIVLFLMFLFIVPTSFAQEVTEKFTGQEQDVNGLYYYGSRYYDPDLGRFTQPDSITPSLTSQGLNPYSYVNNNPINFTDPMGHTASYGYQLIPPWKMDNGDAEVYTGKPGTPLDAGVNKQIVSEAKNIIAAVREMLKSNIDATQMQGILAQNQADQDARYVNEYPNTTMGKMHFTPEIPLYITATGEVLIDFSGVNSDAGVLGMGLNLRLSKMLYAGHITPALAESLEIAANGTYTGIWRKLKAGVENNGLCINATICTLRENNWQGALVKATDILSGELHFFPVMNSTKFGSLTVVDNSNFTKLLNGGSSANIGEWRNSILHGYRIPDAKQIIMPFEEYYGLLTKKPYAFATFEVNPW